jgi:hypothetical protein
VLRDQRHESIRPYYLLYKPLLFPSRSSSVVFTRLSGPRSRPTTPRSRSCFTTGGQFVSMSSCRAFSGTCDQILLPVGTFLSESYSLLSVGLPLWREDWSAVCSAITQLSETHRTRNHSFLSHLRLPQPGRSGPRICVPHKKVDPVIPLGRGFPLRRLLWFTGLRWRYSNQSPYWIKKPPRWGIKPTTNLIAPGIEPGHLDL